MNDKENNKLPNLTISTLGKVEIKSPLTAKQNFVSDSMRVLLSIRVQEKADGFTNDKLPFHSFEKAGPRRDIFFNSQNTKAAIITCGGLCPGLNAIIRTIVRQLWNRYGVKNIVGIRYGYQGLSNNGETFLPLDPTVVEDIHNLGGTILGSSRGTPPTDEIVDNLVKNNINLLFTIGGDGTMKGAQKISEEVKKRNLKISVIGIPKTIDNDIPFVEKSFGYETAVEMASKAIGAAHEEARGHYNGIGLIKIMGRNAGFIAASATLATGVVDACLVPEIKFKLDGKDGLIDYLKHCFEKKKHAVVVVAEGAGQELVDKKSQDRDPSGNIIFTDIGVFFKNEINRLLASQNIRHSLKYIDPSYTVRSAPPNCFDRVFCSRMAQNAVHAAMAGKTSMLIGFWHGEMTHVPFSALNHRIKKINPNGAFWFTVIESTTQSVGK